MTKVDKRLEGMRNNPRNDWKIDDVEALCRSNDIRYQPPNKGSHAKVSDPSQTQILTIPFKRPIKAVYIKELVKFVDSVLADRQIKALHESIEKLVESRTSASKTRE